MPLVAAVVAIVGTVLAAGSPPTTGLATSEVRLSDGTRLPLAAPAGGALVLVFYSTECPISNAYSPALNAVVRETPPGKLRMIGLCTDPDRPAEALAAHAREYRLAFPVSGDRSETIAAKLGVKVTPEVVVIDDGDRVAYSGRIDDLYLARGKRNARPSHHELRDALSAVLSGRPVAVPRVEAVGCPLPEPAGR